MNDADLRKLSRKQILELLLKQTERAERLQAKLELAESKLRDKTIKEMEAGSIAEAALRLNGVFEAAEAAAAQYLDNIKHISENQQQLNERAEAMALKKAEGIMLECERNCREREAQAENRLKEVSLQIQQMYNQKKALDDIFKDFTVK